MVKRWTLVAAAVAAIAALAVSVASARSGGAPPTKEPGKLIVGFDLPAPGFWNGTASGDTIRNPRGFEVEFAWAIAAELGIEKADVQFLRSPFTGLFQPGDKPFDFALEEITITPERARVVDFSTGYFDANQGILIAKGVARPTSIAALKRLQLCSQATTTGLRYIQTRIRPTKRALVYQTLAAAFKAVETGQCQAIVMDVPLVDSEKKRKPSAYGVVAGQILTNEKYGALFEKGNPLRADVNAAIQELRANGTIDRLQRRWLPFTRYPTLR